MGGDTLGYPVTFEDRPNFTQVPLNVPVTRWHSQPSFEAPSPGCRPPEGALASLKTAPKVEPSSGPWGFRAQAVWKAGEVHFNAPATR